MGVKMSSKKYKAMKVPSELEQWVLARQKNIQKMVGVPVTKAFTMRVIAKTDGVNITPEILKKLIKNE